MSFFELIVDPLVSMPLDVKLLKEDVYKNDLCFEAFEKVPKMAVGYYENSPTYEECDLLLQPTYLVSDQMKRLWSLYEPKMQFKGLQLYSTNLQENRSLLYWWPYIPYIACLSEQTTKYPTGTLKQLVLDFEAVQNTYIFRVKGLLENKVIVSLSVAESMLRRKMLGISFRTVALAIKECEEHEK